MRVVVNVQCMGVMEIRVGLWRVCLGGKQIISSGGRVEQIKDKK